MKLSKGRGAQQNRFRQPAHAEHLPAANVHLRFRLGFRKTILVRALGGVLGENAVWLLVSLACSIMDSK